MTRRIQSLGSASVRDQDLYSGRSKVDQEVFQYISLRILSSTLRSKALLDKLYHVDILLIQDALDCT